MPERGADHFDPDIFAERAREMLLGAPQAPGDPIGGDHTVAKIRPDPGMMVKARQAAVLVPVVARSEGATVLLTRRADGMRNHSGQIAFPGGRIDPTDDGPLRAALREAFEEIGLPRQAVQPLGFMAPYFSITGYHITPVVALIEPDMPLVLNPTEVTDAFEVPLKFLMSAGNHQIESREFNGVMRKYYAITFGERYIWGVTAGIIRLLYERLYA